MKYSLSKKLFTITLSLILGIMLLTYFSQAFFFEKFYSYKRINYLVHEVDKFHDLYALHVDENTDLMKVLEKFEDDNNAQIAITSLNGRPIYLSNKFDPNSDSSTKLANFYAELINNTDLINDVIKKSKTRYVKFYNEKGRGNKFS